MSSELHSHSYHKKHPGKWKTHCIILFQAELSWATNESLHINDFLAWWETQNIKSGSFHYLAVKNLKSNQKLESFQTLIVFDWGLLVENNQSGEIKF